MSATTLRPIAWSRVGGVGEVVLALGVAGVEPVEGVPEAGQLEDVAARVDLVDRPLLGRAVAFLDDPEEAAGRVAEDAAEAGGVGHDGGAEQAGGPVAALAVEQVGQGLGPDQRLVADQDQRGPSVVVQQGRQTLTASPVPSCRSGWRRGCRARLSRHSRTWSAPVADDDDDRPGPGPSGRVDHVADHRPAADLVQDLGLLRLHPLALTGRQDDRHGTLHRRPSSKPHGKPSGPGPHHDKGIIEVTLLVVKR